MAPSHKGGSVRGDVRHALSTMPQRHAERQFLAHIPGRCHEGDTGKEGAFSEADCEACEREASGRLDQGEEDRGNGPAHPGCQSRPI